MDGFVAVPPHDREWYRLRFKAPLRHFNAIDAELRKHVHGVTCTVGHCDDRTVIECRFWQSFTGGTAFIHPLISGIKAIDPEIEIEFLDTGPERHPDLDGT